MPLFHTGTFHVTSNRLLYNTDNFVFFENILQNIREYFNQFLSSSFRPYFERPDSFCSSPEQKVPLPFLNTNYLKRFCSRDEMLKDWIHMNLA